MFVVTMLFICLCKLGCLSWPGHSWKRDFNLSESFSWLNKGIYIYIYIYIVSDIYMYIYIHRHMKKKGHPIEFHGFLYQDIIKNNLVLGRS